MKKEELLQQLQELVSEDFGVSVEIFESLCYGMAEYKKKIDKKNVYIELIIKQLKPKYLEELKKILSPEIFKVLEINL